MRGGVFGRCILAACMAVMLAGAPVASVLALYVPLPPIKILPCLGQSPSVKSVFPDGGPPGVGTAVSITGTCLGSATAVYFGHTAASFSYNAANDTLTAEAPPLTNGGELRVDVTVANANGTSAVSSADEFLYSPLHIDTVIDSNANQWPNPAAGDVLTLNGWGFGASQGQGMVILMTAAGGIVRQVTGGPAWSWSDGSIDFTLPADLIQGQYRLAVVNQNGQADPVSFTVTPQIQLTPSVKIGGPGDLGPGGQHGNPVFPGDLMSVTVGLSGGAGGAASLEIAPVGQTTPSATISGPVPPLLWKFYLTADGSSTGTPLAPGSYTILLQVGGLSSNRLPLTIAGPVITSWGYFSSGGSPVPATPGSPYAVVGQGFGPSQGQGYILLTPLGTLVTQSNGSQQLANVRVAQVTSWTATDISFQLPGELNPGQYALQVVTGSGAATPQVLFYVYPPGTSGSWAAAPLPTSAPLLVADTAAQAVENLSQSPYPGLSVDTYSSENNLPNSPSGCTQPPHSSDNLCPNIPYNNFVQVHAVNALPSGGAPQWSAGAGPGIAPNDSNYNWYTTNVDASQLLVTTNTDTFLPITVSFTPNIFTYQGEPNNYLSEGNHIHLVATVQEWQDGNPASPDTNAINDRSPDGNAGSWVNLPGAQATTDLFGPQATAQDGANANNQATNNATVSQTLQVPVQLEHAVSPNYLQVQLSIDQLETTDGSWNTQFTGTYGAWEVQVVPIGGFQLDQIPFTIVYQPPGSLSTASFEVGNTFATAVTAGNSVAQSNLVTNTQSRNESWTIGLKYKGMGFGYTNTGSWQNSTTTGTDVTASASATDSNQWQNLSGPGGSPSIPGLVPGGGTLAQQPFWFDRFELLVDPQFAIFDQGGNARTVLMSSGGEDHTAVISVAYLAACATGLTNPDGSSPCQTLGGVSGAQPLLSSQEARSLLQLDPFYAALSQNITPDPKRATPVLDNEGNPLLDVPYGGCTGTNPEGGCVPGAPAFRQLTTTQTEQVTTGGTAASISGVSATQGSTQGAGLTEPFGIVGFSSTSGQSQTNAQATTVTEGDSNAVSNGTVTQLSYTINDDKQGEVSVYQDNLFGSFMFVDPNAPRHFLNPQLNQPLPVTLQQILPEILRLQELQREHLGCPPICPSQGSGASGGAGGSANSFQDLSSYAWAAPAIDALAQEGIIHGVGDGRFDPGGQVTRAQFASLMMHAFQLPSSSQPPAFQDVGAGSWEYQAVGAASPYFDNYPLPGGGYAFEPDQGMQRQEVAAAMVRVLVRQGKLTLPSPEQAQTVLARLSDAGAVDPSLEPYVATAIQAGIMKGFPDGSFQPQAILNRAQAAVLLDGAAKLFPANAGQGQIVTQPAVSSVSPATGPTGTQVTIGGIGFTGATAVSFGGAAATSFQVVSDGEITAVAPPGSGTVDVTVTTPGGTSPTGGADQFTYR